MEIDCDYCGKKFEFKGGKVHFNRSKKHYCSLDCLCKSNIIHGLASKKNGKQDKKYRIWCNVKKRAKQNGIKFELTINDIPKIPEYCPILGIKIQENIISSPLDSSPSLDRINPKKGYVKGNIRIICNRANRIKSDATIKELRLILKDAKKL
jgi:hypothetical protein